MANAHCTCTHTPDREFSQPYRYSLRSISTPYNYGITTVYQLHALLSRKSGGA